MDNTKRIYDYMTTQITKNKKNISYTTKEMIFICTTTGVISGIIGLFLGSL